MAEKHVRSRDNRKPYHRSSDRKRQRSIMGWVGETMRGMFSAPLWVSEMFKAEEAGTSSSATNVLGDAGNPIDITDDEGNEKSGQVQQDVSVMNSISVSQPRLHGSKRFRGDNESTKVKEQQSVPNPQRNDSDCSSVASSSGCSSSNSNDQNQVQPPPSKRRVSFNSQPLIYQSNVSGTQKFAKELNNNLSFHESFRERLNKTEASINPDAITSPLCQSKNKLAPKLFTDALKEESAASSAMSLSFSQGFAPQMTPQRPLGESLFYRNNRKGSSKSSVTATPSFNASLFGTPVFLPSPSNPHIKTRPSSTLSQMTGVNNTQVPLSENALKILKRLEQPVTHTEIYRMRKLGSLKTFSPLASNKPTEGNGEIIPSAPLPSFSFLSSKRVMPPKISPPSFKFASTPASKSLIDPLKSSSSIKNSASNSQSIVSKTNMLDEDQGFTFMMPTPRKFGFEGGLSGDASTKKALTFDVGNVTSAKPSGDVSLNSKPNQTLEAPAASKTLEINQSGMAKLAVKFKLQAGSWECSQCLSKNDASLVNCAACEFPKPGSKNDKNEKVMESKSLFSGNLGPSVSCEKQEKISQLCKPGSVSGPSSIACLTSNPPKETAESCSKSLASSSPSLAPVSTFSNKLAEKFKRPSGAWDCSTCLVTNKSNDTQCVACQSMKPGSIEPKAVSSSFGSASSSEAPGNTAAPKFAFGSGSLTNASQLFSFSASPAVASIFNPPVESKDQGEPATFAFGGAKPTFKPIFGSQNDSSSQQNGSGFTFGSFAPSESGMKNNFQPKLTSSSLNFNFSSPSAKLQNSSNDHSGTNSGGTFPSLSNGSSEEKKLIPSFSFSAPPIANAVNSGPMQQESTSVFGLQ